MSKEHVKLSIKDRAHLEELLKKGSLKSRTSKRITALLALDQGHTYLAVESIAHLSRVSLTRLAAGPSPGLTPGEDLLTPLEKARLLIS